MSDLPQGWIKTTFSELFDNLQYGLTAKADNTAPGTRFLRITDIHNGTVLWDFVPGLTGEHDLERYILADGDFVFARSGSIEKVARLVNPPRAVFASYLIRARPLVPQTADYLAHFARSDDYLTQITDRAAGISMPNVNAAKLGTITVSVPSLPEQQRIVAKVDSLTGKSKCTRDHLDHVMRLVETYKQAILTAAFRGDLTREWREGRHLPAPHTVLLGDVVESFSYGSTTKSAKEGRVPVLRMGNIQDGKLDWTNLVFTDDAAEIAKYRLRTGDVLFNRTNSPALVGKTALFTGEREAIYAGYLIKMRCKPQILPAFLTYCLNAPNGRAYSWYVKTDGVSLSNINTQKLAAFRFDLPSMAEQAEIVRRIESMFGWIDRLANDATRARKLIDHLDKSVLAKAFKGELVPQDPSDEPASILLERMRAERTATSRPKRSRKKVA